MKRILVGVLLCGAVGAGIRAFMADEAVAPVIITARVAAGGVAETVGGTGTLQAVTTVQVGTQVSGIVRELHADFNSLVRKGDIIARLDPSTIETQIEQARANLVRSEADVARLQVVLEDVRLKRARFEELAARGIIPQAELETAAVNVKSAEAQVRASQAGITQAKASLNQHLVSLQHTVIRAPIDGLVISRNVDRGQTVASSMSAPTLFVLAADLTKMQVVANLDESDVGRIRPGQQVTFTVDAYPGDQFRGRVTQVRLQPITTNNVVAYATIIDVPNPDLRLKPGMTANVVVQIANAEDALLVPNAALRFRPTAATYSALGIPAPSAVPKRVLPSIDAEDEPAPAMDTLFAPLDVVETPGRVWVHADGALTPVDVVVGITDGQRSQLIAGALAADAELVTSVAMSATAARPAETGGLFMPGGMGGSRR